LRAETQITRGATEAFGGKTLDEATLFAIPLLTVVFEQRGMVTDA
jgi:hypothetical protein